MKYEEKVKKNLMILLQLIKNCRNTHQDEMAYSNAIIVQMFFLLLY